MVTQDWYCPNCDAVARTGDAKIPMHRCKIAPSFMVPLVRSGLKAKVEAVERQDFIGKESVQLDADGRPVMAIVTTTDEGQDVAVFAPAAQGIRE